ncbi:MAG: tetratricopeptide repeat protein [Gemmatimonadetes bacterium]|nr:tetratricopeptide repeat protein [Gemmatimonadota bacterium]
MAFWKKLFGSRDEEKVDYYREGLELMQAGQYHEAVTSFRLALRDNPNDQATAQQIAIAYTRIGLTDEAVRAYRGVLERDPEASGAHYGLAFLLLREGRVAEAVPHLRAFLARPPEGPEARAHVEHARETLAELEASASEPGGA